MKKKNNSMAKILKQAIIIIIVLWLLSNLVYWRGINKVADKKGEDIGFVVSEGQSAKVIAQNLFDQNLIESKFWFVIYVWKKDLTGSLQAGEYILNPNMPINKIANSLAAGQALSKEKEIKIIEGWNLREISQYFEREGMFQSEELLELVGYPKIDYRYATGMPYPGNYADQFSFLKDKPAYYSLEGYLFPDTYRIFQDTTLEKIVLKMLNNFDKKLTSEMRADIASQGKTIYEIIIMASLIEKEVRTEKDMKIVSGIFWDRIKNGQALESCATLAYILGMNKPQYTIEDTKTDSPYNSYLILGLPPGPISNPGLQAIKAAIYPEYTDYNYFLNRPDKDETVFSETYDDHLRNKAKYLQ